jgi:transmembrane sensor
MTEDARRPSGAPDPVPDWDTLARYVAREGSADEMSHVAQWLEANPAERALLGRLSDVTAPGTPTDIDVEAALAKVHAQMGEVRQAPPLSVSRSSTRRRWQPMAIGGLLAAAAVVGILVVTRRAEAPGTPRTAAQTFATSVGKRDSITLADGSLVLLGADSRLTVPAGFAAGSRTVELRGDAYFDVRHDAAHPFAVQVGSAVIQDVGTTFTVESDDANATVVTVVSGSVRLRGVNAAADAGVILSAGQRGSIDEAGRTTTERATAADDDVAWTTGKLVFRDASFTRVAAEVYRWYGVRLHVGDASLMSQHISTTLFTNQPVDEVLHVIELSLGVRIERQGDSAIVMSGRSSSPTAR